MDLPPLALENQHVRLEPLHEAHRDGLRVVAQDPDLWTFTTIRGDGADFDPWFDLMLGNQSEGKQISHAVIDPGANRIIGHSAFLSFAFDHRRLEIGWTWYAAEARGTRINPSCKHLLLGRAFSAGARRVELKTHGLNQRSQNAMLKMGAQKEGVLRQHTKTWRGDWRDTVFFSVLENEWPAVKAGLEARIKA